MSVAAAIIGWIVIGGLAASPFAAVALLAVPRLRRWWLRPLQRRRARRRARAVSMQQARRDARTAILENELDVLDEGAAS